MYIRRSIMLYTALLAQLFITGAVVAEQPYIAGMKPTPEMVLEAKKNPNGWVYVIQGNYKANVTIPPEAIVGAWEVDSSGNIMPDSFQTNPKYKPPKH